MTTYKLLFRVFVLCGLCLFVSKNVTAQISESVVHIDKEFYVSGEIMWYAVHLPEFFNNIDRIVLVEVVDDRGRIVEEHKLRTNNKTTVTGYYKIPYDVPTGMYRIFFHGVHRLIDQNIKLAEIEIPIYNDLERVVAPMSETASNENNTASLTDLSVSIDLPGDAVVGQESMLRVSVLDVGGAPVSATLSISVLDAELCGKGRVVIGDPVEYRSVQALQEGMVLKGTLYHKQGDALQVNVLGLYSPLEKRVVYTKSDEYGRFFAKIPYFTSQRELQFLEYPEEIDAFDVVLSRELNPGPISTKVKYTSEVLAYLELSRKRKKIYRYFTSLEHSLDVQNSQVEPQELKPGVRFKIEEYEQFDNMHSFFGELITALKFEENDEVFTATLENPRGSTEAGTHLDGDPLFIVDGKATRDADFIARMDLSVVKYVDLFFEPRMLRKYFNVVGRNGVIIITTRIPDSPFPEENQSDIFTVNGILPPAEFQQSTTKGQPRISPQLYWKGNVETDYDGTSSIEFLQSDDLSNFRVVVVAQTADGRRGTATLEYKPVQ